MARAIREIYKPVGWSAGAEAGFRGQVGKYTYYPPLPNYTRHNQEGSCPGNRSHSIREWYGAELERTMIVGEPTKEQEKFFRLMIEARKTALESIKAGVRCSDVDGNVRRFFKERPNEILETPHRP